MGVEPTYAAWEAAVLPMNYSRVCFRLLYQTASYFATPNLLRPERLPEHQNHGHTDQKDGQSRGHRLSALLGEMDPRLMQLGLGLMKNCRERDDRNAALLRALGRTGDAAPLNRAYLDHLGEGSYLLPGAQALCRALAPRCTLAIVTNGVARAQRRRFEASPLNGLIPWLFISEELGASKPDSAFFAPVLRTLGNPDPRRVLMVGDNLLADIQGGIQAGLDTAWYNPGRLPGDPAIVPTWEVDGYAALQALILKEEKNNI